jgi:branched-chain amino acid transport system permease protein
VAIRFVIIFGTMNLVTFAHGEVYMIGAFVGYFALSVYHLPWEVGPRPRHVRPPGSWAS